MKRKLLLFLLLFGFGLHLAMAQERTITGTVTNADDGSTLPGANIVVKGTTIGTVTDEDGKYKLKVSEDARRLIVSFVGMEPKEVTIGRSDVINIQLSSGVKLDDVVVTALGIKREKKALGYAVQEVKADEIAKTQEQNVVTALQGKVAGVNISSGGGSPGASTSIIIRGGTSLIADNQPLFVVDGIPIDNTTVSSQTDPGGNRAMDINPDDIESITVLKGPSAAALYGLKAAEGAIIITTKRGKKGEGKISFSSTFSWDEPLRLPPLQSKWGQGTADNDETEINGEEYRFVPFHDSVRSSWGPAISGEPFNGKTYDNIGNFYQTALTQKHSLSAQGGTEKATYYLSFSQYDQDGIVPNTYYNRTTVRFNSDVTIKQNLKAGVSINYTNSENNRTISGTNGVMMSILSWPITHDMSDWETSGGEQKTLLPSSLASNDLDNPYWSVKNNTTNEITKRFIGNAYLNWQPFKFLDLRYQLGRDFYHQDYRHVKMPGSLLALSSEGALSERTTLNEITSSKLLVTFDYTITPDIKTKILLGQEAEERKRRSIYFSGTEFMTPDFIGINNTTHTSDNFRDVSQVSSIRRLFGVFGSARLDYRNWVYIEYTGRNDWSSTLPEANQSFYYQSVNVGLIVTDMLGMMNNPVLPYGKIRASYAEVGKDAPPHKIETELEGVTELGGGYEYGYFGNNTRLRPESTYSAEVGIEAKFLQGKIGFDFAWYKQRSEDQIFEPRITNTSGFLLAWVNGGVIENTGMELMMDFHPVRKKDFKWDMTLNWSKNEGKLVELPKDIKMNYRWEVWFGPARGTSQPGKSFAGIEGTGWARVRVDEDLEEKETEGTITPEEQTQLDIQRQYKGEVIIENDRPSSRDYQNGLPKTDSEFYETGADREPDWISGLTNTLTYKDLTLSFMLQYRRGGDVFNHTKLYLMQTGMAEMTEGRWDPTNPTDPATHTIIDGVVPVYDEEDVLTGYEKNNIEVPMNLYYWQKYAEDTWNFIEDGTHLRLSYVSLKYRFPKAWMDKVKVANAELTLTGRNLLLITDYSGADPDVSVWGAGLGGTGSQGFDSNGVPKTRSFSLGLKLSF